MIAVEHSQPVHTKLSLFRHFSRKSNDGPVSAKRDHHSYGVAVQPTELYRNLDMTPPLSPLSSSHSSPDSSPMSTPRLTKDKSQRRDVPITLVHRFDIPLISRDRLSRGSSRSSSSSGRQKTRAVSTSLPTMTFASTPRITPWTLYLPPAQVHALYMGYLPQRMEDEWFIFSEGPDAMGKLKVHFHRSWTGAKIAELFVVIDVKGEGAGKIVGVKWDERSTSGKMNSDEVKHVIRTTVQWELGVDLEPEHY